MERLWNRNYCKVMTANFALFFAFYVLTPLLPLYLSENFGATKDVIGLVLSGYTITALLSRPFSGYFVDTFPRKTVLMVCFTAFAIFFAGYLAASTLLMFTIVRTLHGAPFGSLTVANATMAIDVLPSSRRTEGIGFYGLSNNLAMAIAPTIGIYVYDLSRSFELLFWIALVLAFAGLAVDGTVKTLPNKTLPNKTLPRPLPAGRGVYTTSEEKNAATRKEKNAATRSNYSPPFREGQGEGLGPGEGLLRLDRFFLLRGWLLGANMLAFGFSFGVLSNYLAIYGKEELGMTSGTGTYFMLCSIGLMVSRLLGSKALRQGRLTHNAGEGMCISLVGYTLFILVPTLSSLLTLHSSLLTYTAYYGSALLIGLGNGHLWPAFQNMTICVARNNQRGTANSTILISWDAGMGLGILVGGVAAELMGYAAAFWAVVLVNAMGVATYFVWTRGFFLQRNLNDTVH
ncbi:MAG: MFS transporter [Prevotella sp.]|nr:MFS transporter [Prevotella sp.]